MGLLGVRLIAVPFTDTGTAPKCVETLVTLYFWSHESHKCGMYGIYSLVARSIIFFIIIFSFTIVFTVGFHVSRV